MPKLTFSTSNIESKENKIVSIGSGSTDSQYPSAKAVYSAINSICSTLITNSTPADYIVSQGSSSVWVWRKWASGISECWGTLSTAHQSGSGTTTFHTGVSTSYSQRTASWPSGLFNAAPKVFCTAIDAGGGVAGSEDDGSTASTCNVSVYGMSTAIGNINVHAYGRWQ